MPWNIIVECVGEDGKRSTTTLGTIEGVAGTHPSAVVTVSTRILYFFQVLPH